MCGTHYVPRVKEEVLALGAKGATYSEIQKRFPVPKGTLSYWFHTAGISPGKDTKRVRAHLIRARDAARVVIRARKKDRLALAELSAHKSIAQVDLANVSFQKSLTAMLYWAEG